MSRISVRLAALLLCAIALRASGQTVPGERAGVSGFGEVERARPSLELSDPAWDAAAVAGGPARRAPLVIAPGLAGDPVQIGVNSLPPGGPISVRSAGTVTVEGDTLFWRLRVEASGVGALRLHWMHLDLPPGATLTASGEGSRWGGYVIRGRGSLGTGEDWTPVLDGARAFVEYRGPVAAGRPTCSIVETAEIAAPWPPAPTQLRVLPCEVDVQCQSPDAVARDAVGYMVFSGPTGTLLCTGTLLNDTDPGTTRGWLLTSRRCISTQASASSLTVYWFFQTPTCDGTPPSPDSLPVSLGATLLQVSAATDLSFLQLAQDPSAGQGLAGWTTDEPVGTMMSIHHPLGTFKRAAVGTITTVPPICAGLLPFYQFHYVDYSVGITEDGSGGAPLFNAQWQVVGQLYGTCATTSPDCSNPSQWNAVFGKFSRSFSLIAPYLTGQGSPSRIYVNAAATGAGTGLSWTDAYTDLAVALTTVSPAAGGTEVWVAAGVYKPLATGVESSFRLVTNVQLYGGFAGTESVLSERNIAANPTILSGDVNGDDAANFVNRADNVYHVVRATGVDQTAVLDGFTIRGGNAAGASGFNNKGGGLYAESATPRIRNCTFTDNSAAISGGGAAYAENASLDIQGCAFAGNFATSTGGGLSVLGGGGTIASCQFTGNSALGNGGGIDLYDSGVSISACTFLQNSAVGRGGGLNCFPSGAPTILDCRFELNTAAYGGGGANAFGASPAFSRCVFLKNTAGNFGGAFLHTNNAQSSISACRLLGNSSGLEGGAINANSGTLDLVNCEFSGNKSTTNSGGGFFDTHNCIATVRSCSFSGNAANTGMGGGMVVDDSTASVINCVFWGNTDASGSTQNGQVKLVTGGVTVSYSLLQGLDGSLGGAGNIGGNPLFGSAAGPDAIVGTEDDDLAPGSGSPAVDSGDSQAASTILTDIRGHARREDDVCVPNTGTGPLPPVDMGAIEKAGCVCYPNCDGSTAAPILNANDFSCFLNAFANGNSYANCDESTVLPVLNANDFSCFLNAFAGGCQ